MALSIPKREPINLPPKSGVLDHIMLVREGQIFLENLADPIKRKPYGAYIYIRDPIQEIEGASR